MYEDSQATRAPFTQSPHWVKKRISLLPLVHQIHAQNRTILNDNSGALGYHWSTGPAVSPSAIVCRRYRDFFRKWFSTIHTPQPLNSVQIIPCWTRIADDRQDVLATNYNAFGGKRK